jgi:hypothetical protein
MKEIDIQNVMFTEKLQNTNHGCGDMQCKKDSGGIDKDE